MGIHIQREDHLVGQGNPNTNNIIPDYNGQFYVDIANINSPLLYFGVVTNKDENGKAIDGKWTSLSAPLVSNTNWGIHIKNYDSINPEGIRVMAISDDNSSFITFRFKDSSYIKFEFVEDGLIDIDTSKIDEILNTMKEDVKNELVFNGITTESMKQAFENVFGTIDE